MSSNPVGKSAPDLEWYSQVKAVLEVLIDLTPGFATTFAIRLIIMTH